MRKSTGYWMTSMVFAATAYFLGATFNEDKYFIIASVFVAASFIIGALEK
jgi:hypothetical protein